MILRSTLGWCTAVDMLGARSRARNPVLVGPLAGASSGRARLVGASQPPPPPAGLAKLPASPAWLSLSAPVRLQCTAGSASQAVQLTFTGSGLTYLSLVLHDPGEGQPLMFVAQAAASRPVGIASVSSLQSQGTSAAGTMVELSSAAGSGSSIASRGLKCSLALLPTGQLALSNISDRARPVLLWKSAVSAQGTAPFRLVLSAAGSLAVLDSRGSTAGAWSSQTGCLLGSAPFLLQVRRLLDHTLLQCCQLAAQQHGVPTRPLKPLTRHWKTYFPVPPGV